MRGAWRRLGWGVLWALDAAWIFVLSDRPLPEGFSLPNFPASDKLFHALHFGALCLLGLLTVRPAGRRGTAGVTLLCLAYAAADELHQIGVPGRTPDPLDWLADAAGILVVTALWRAVRRAVRR